MVNIGILGLQGDIHEHFQTIKEIEGANPLIVKTSNDLKKVDALVIGGGESTTIGRMLERKALMEPIRELVQQGLPTLGTCAGMVLLSKVAIDNTVGETSQPLLKLMDISVVRNAFGRQKSSFEARIFFENIGELHVAFIRAPVIKESWGKAKIVSFLEHPIRGKLPVAAIQDNIIATAFHPEITNEPKVHQLIVSTAKGRR